MPSSSPAQVLCAALVFGLVVPQQSRGEAPPDDGHAELPAINTVLDDLHKAASQFDEARYFGHFAPEGVFLGTDPTERWTVEAFRAYAHPYFAEGKGWTYTPAGRNVVVRGDTATFDEQLQNTKYGLCRGTGSLRKIGTEWKVVQYSLSFPIPNALAPKVVSLIRGFAASAPVTGSTSPSGSAHDR